MKQNNYLLNNKFQPAMENDLRTKQKCNFMKEYKNRNQYIQT